MTAVEIMLIIITSAACMGLLIIITNIYSEDTDNSLQTQIKSLSDTVDELCHRCRKNEDRLNEIERKMQENNDK